MTGKGGSSIYAAGDSEEGQVRYHASQLFAGFHLFLTVIDRETYSFEYSGSCLSLVN